MICAKSVLPRYTQYSKSKARSVHESALAVQVGDTLDSAANPVNRGLQLSDYRFNRTLVHKSSAIPYETYVTAQS